MNKITKPQTTPNRSSSKQDLNSNRSSEYKSFTNEPLFQSDDQNYQAQHIDKNKSVIPNKKNKVEILKQLSSKYVLKKNTLNADNIKSIIIYIFNNISDNNHAKENFPEELDKLKINRSRLHQQCTKSMFDIAATIYIANLANSIDGINSIKEVFAHGFKKSFKTFLKVQGISDNIINQIPGRYFNSIKYTGISYIRFNHYVLDLSSYGKDILLELNKPLKNSIIRATFTTQDISKKKDEAKKYYKDICIKIDKLVNTEEKIQCKLQLIYFLKNLNLTQRKNCRSKMGYSYLLTMAEPIFKTLDINNFESQLQFIHHGMILTFHSNKGMYLKRYIMKIPVMCIGLSALLLATAPLDAAGISALIVTGGILSLLVIIGVSLDVLNILYTGASGLAEVWRNLNSGDSLTSFTNSTQKTFIDLLENENSTSELPSISPNNISLKNYKNHPLWNKVPETSKILKFHNNNKITKSEQMETHRLIMNGMYRSGNQLRKADLSNIISNFKTDVAEYNKQMDNQRLEDNIEENKIEEINIEEIKIEKFENNRD